MFDFQQSAQNMAQEFMCVKHATEFIVGDEDFCNTRNLNVVKNHNLLALTVHIKLNKNLLLKPISDLNTPFIYYLDE